MTKRSYQQYCNIAYALDIVGERWTMLMVRELYMGPKRFKDLLANLPGIGTNLLSVRLTHLEEHGLLVPKMLPPPLSAQVYELTTLGRELEIVLKALWRWGSYTNTQPAENDRFRPGWSVLAMQFAFRPEHARDFRAVLEYHIGDFVFHARVDGSILETKDGPAERPDLVFITDEATYEAIVTQKTTMADEIKKETVEVNGNPNLIDPSLDIFGIPTGVPDN